MLKALIFDSYFDDYRGIVIYVRVFEGMIKNKSKLFIASNKKPFEVNSMGYLVPSEVPQNDIMEGEIGYIVTGLKDIQDVRVGDTITDNIEILPLPGYKKNTPMVFANIFCVDNSDYEKLRDALGKLALNDASLIYVPEISSVLGMGFNCGFLGLLHLDIITTRIEREFDLDIIITAPSIQYEIQTIDGNVLQTSSPNEIPKPETIVSFKEPFMKLEVICRKDDIGSVMALCEERRGEYVNTNYMGDDRATVIYNLPLARIIADFYDRLKNATAGHASMSYEFLEMREGKLVKVDILIAHEIIHSLSFICHLSEADRLGRSVVSKLIEVVPRQQFAVAIQAAVGARVIARETLKAYRKDVTAKLYGGDIRRRMKLLEKQKKGKKKMSAMGHGTVELPKEAFLAVVKAG